MAALSNKEKEIISRIFKDYSVLYNANSISKKVGITRIGAYKALKKLEKIGILKSERLGRAIFYSIDYNDYSKKYIELILIEESRKHARWIDEFKEIFNYVKILMLYGSVARSDKNAKDLDLLIVLEQKNNNNVNNFIKIKNQVLLNRIHPLKQTEKDLIKNLKKKDKVILNALKEGIVLKGYEKLREVMQNVSS